MTQGHNSPMLKVSVYSTVEIKCNIIHTVTSCY